MNISFLLLIYLVGAFVTYFSGKKLAKTVALITSIIGLICWGSYLPEMINGKTITESYPWIEVMNINLHFYLDGLSYSMLALCSILLPIIISTTKNAQFEKANTLYALVLFMAFAMCGTFLSIDGFVYYIFWELALIPIFFIGLIWGNDEFKVRKKTMITFFIYTFAGSLLMLVAFVYLYMQNGSFDWNTLKQTSLSVKEANWIYLAFFLAYAIKIPVFPFHTWQANTYEKSPAIGTMLLSGIMLKMGLYSILRWQLPLTQGVESHIVKTVIVLCIIGIIYASLIALKQNHIKRLLAYSSMAHVGLIAAGAYTNSIDGTQGAIIQMLAHGFVVVGLFYIAEIIYSRYQTYHLNEMSGIRSQAVKLSSFFLIFVFSSIGLPGTFSFVGEFTLLYSLSTVNLWYAIFAGTTIIIGAYYMLKMFQTSMLGAENSRAFADVSTKEFVILSVLVICIIGLGIYPEPIYKLISLTHPIF